LDDEEDFVGNVALTEKHVSLEHTSRSQSLNHFLYKVDILVHEEGNFLDKDLIGDHDDFTPQRGRQTLNHLLLFIQRVQVFTVVPQEVFNSGRHLLRQVHSVSQVVKNLDLSG